MKFLLYGDTPELRKKLYEGICYTKDKKWSYEEEWRVIISKNDGKVEKYSDILFNKEELESITFGVKVDTKLMTQLMEIKNKYYLNCQAFKMTHEFGKFKRIQIG